MTKVLFVNHKKSQCGVYEFGRNIGDALKASAMDFVYRECGSANEFARVAKQESADAIIYNYHPATMRWLNIGVTKRIKCPQFGVIHEVTQAVADRADNSLFNFHIAHDPTLLLKNPIVFKTGRLIPPYERYADAPTVTTIGSFGFGTDGKGFEKIVALVEQEFGEAAIRFNIPFSTFCDADGANAHRIADECRRLVTRPGIRLEITHDYLDQAALLDFLASNTINVFLYEDRGIPRGLSSATDVALAAGRPIAVSPNAMFRHLLDAVPSVSVADRSLKEIIERGVAPLEKLYREWSEEMLCWEYERICNTVLSLESVPRIRTEGILKRKARGAKRRIRNLLGMPPSAPSANGWVSDTSIETLKQPIERIEYSPVANVPRLNRILDNDARELYRPTIEQMFRHLPELMARKIPEANVQQAFVLDTVYRFASNTVDSNILSVGSFEDSAAAFLKLTGLNIDEVDPVLNYDLGTFMNRPTTVNGSYDVIFATSVIEHVEDDESFMRDISLLLKPGGRIVLTCDYLDSYKPGDPIFDVNYRFYTQTDLAERLLKSAAGCRLADQPQWDCENPDFFHAGFNYTFATLVLEKAV